MDETNSNSLRSILSNFRVRLLLIIFAFLVLFLLLTVFVLNFSEKSNKLSNNQVSITPSAESNLTTDNKEQKVSRNAPQVYFKSYTNSTSSIALPNIVKTYSLKTNFTQNDILPFAKKFGVETIKPGIDRNVVIYNQDDKEKKGVINFDKITGAFSYHSFGILRPRNYLANQSPFIEAEAFIKELGIYDNSISCKNKYQAKGMPETIIYVECHRDLSNSDMSIVSLGGVLNISENRRISELTVGSVDDLSPIDESITNVENSNNMKLAKDNGKARPNDFNTITLSITKDGRILSVVSNLRWIEKAITINSGDVLNSQEALSFFENHKAPLSLTIPAGSGSVDWNKVYPENKAVANNAVIKEISLVYLEKPTNISQEEYAPYYLIKGIAMLNSGYNVKFVQAIPAIKSNLTAVSVAKGVAGVKTLIAQNKKLQMDTFTPGVYKSPTPEITSATIKNPTNTPSPTIIPESRQCLTPQLEKSLTAIGKEITWDVPGYGRLVIVQGGDHTFFLKSATLSNYSYKSVLDAFVEQVRRQYIINISKWMKTYYLDSPTYVPYKNLPAYSSINTIDDMYKLFDIINTAPSEDLKGKSDLYMQLIRYGAPPTQIPDYITDKTEILRTVTKNVAENVLELKKQNKINEWTNKEDIFPPETIRLNFDGVLVGPYYNDKYFGLTCHISGNSPVLYFYPSEKIKLSVTTKSPLTYTDPSITENTWNITAYPNETIKQGEVQRSNLYYEYDKSKVVFSEPSTGFIVKTGEWKDFIKNNLSIKLGLNQKETESLITEVNNALFNASKTQYLKLSLIDQRELGQKLPLTINPKPDSIYRINLFVKPIDKSYPIKSPEISPVVRVGFTAVELGAYTK